MKHSERKKRNVLLVLFTHGKFDIFFASFAFNIATPMKFALAPFLDLGLDGFISGTATHFFAAFGSVPVFLADASMST